MLNIHLFCFTTNQEKREKQGRYLLMDLLNKHVKQTMFNKSKQSSLFFKTSCLTRQFDVIHFRRDWL